jgi:hypothetical protein
MHKKDERTLSAMIAAPITIGTDEYVGVVVIRQYNSGNKKLYVHEVSLKQKFLDSSSNPAQIPATNQGIMFESCLGSSNPAQIPAAKQGNITKVLQNIIFAKFN